MSVRVPCDAELSFFFTEIDTEIVLEVILDSGLAMVDGS